MFYFVDYAQRLNLIIGSLVQVLNNNSLILFKYKDNILFCEVQSNLNIGYTIYSAMYLPSITTGAYHFGKHLSLLCQKNFLFLFLCVSHRAML